MWTNKNNVDLGLGCGRDSGTVKKTQIAWIAFKNIN